MQLLKVLRSLIPQDGHACDPTGQKWEWDSFYLKSTAIVNLPYPDAAILDGKLHLLAPAS